MSAPGHHLIVYRARIRPGGAAIDGIEELEDALHTYRLWFGAVRRLSLGEYAGSSNGFLVERLPEPTDPGYKVVCQMLRENFDLYVPVMPPAQRPRFADDVEREQF